MEYIVQSEWHHPESFVKLQKDLREKVAKDNLLSLVAGIGTDGTYDYRKCYDIISRFARISMPITGSVFTSPRIGIHAVLHFGSKEQITLYVSDCFAGKSSWSLCLSGPEAGSDLLSCLTTATIAENGTWLLNGQKKWITGGIYADFFCVFVRTGKPSKHGFTMFVVPRTKKGVTVERMSCIGAQESGTARVTFENVSLTDKDIIGKLGQGFQIAMDILVEERWISGITSLAMAHRALEECVQWSQKRYLHGKEMFHTQAVRLRLAEMKMSLLPLDAMARDVALRLGEARNKKRVLNDLSAECAGFKACCVASLQTCIQHASLLFGGRAFETIGKGAIIAKLRSEVHGMQCAGGTYDLLMETVARNIFLNASKL